MPEPDRFAADTNIIVSRLLYRHSLPAQALRHAMSRYRLIVSSETLIELGTVLSRPKFDRYLALSDRLSFFDLLRRQAIHIRSTTPIAACRDPKDDKFLALAVAGHANFILTGDETSLPFTPSAISKYSFRLESSLIWQSVRGNKQRNRQPFDLDSSLFRACAVQALQAYTILVVQDDSKLENLSTCGRCPSQHSSGRI